MQPIITENREKIAELCRRHHVRRLSVFGSAVRDDFDPSRSDVDFLVEFGSVPRELSFANYLELESSLIRLLNRPVELVMAGAIKNPFLVRNIEAQQETLYAA